MSRTGFPFSPRKPAGIAKWLLIAFAIGLLAFEFVSALRTRNVTGSDALLGFAFVPWIIGPAAVATMLVGRARSQIEAWLFLVAEATAAASTALVWFWLIYIKPDAQNGVAMMLLPVFQFAALLIAALGVIAVADVVLKSRQHKKPRTVLLVILTIACAILLVLLAWVFGYIRA